MPLRSVDLCRPAIQHLAHAHRHGVHQVRTARFHILVHLRRLGLDHLYQVAQGRQQLFVQGQRSADMNGGGDDVVAALATVDVVIGVDSVTQHAACQGSNHLVGVHVRAGAGAGLEHIHREVLDEVFRQQLLDSLDDGLALRCRQLLQLHVGLGGSSFGQQQGTNELGRHAQTADREVVDRALGLGTVQGLGRHLQLTHAVTLDTGITHHQILASVIGRNRRQQTAIGQLQGIGLPALVLFLAVEVAHVQQRAPGQVQAQAAPMPGQHAVAGGIQQQAERGQCHRPWRGLGAAHQIAPSAR